MRPRCSLFLSLLIVLALALGACTPASEAPTQNATQVDARPLNPNLILATTTSTQDSGLLDVLVPRFETESGYRVQTVAVGSGQAMKLGEDGNADVLLVHAPDAESAFMENGFGSDRALVMHNDFVIVGPSTDPAAIEGMSVVEALKAVVARQATFVSRGDDSGTHRAELGLWKRAGLDPLTAAPPSYLETGQGMGASLTIASEKGAYIVTDRATFLASNANLKLSILVEGDRSLLNIYHVITVNPDRWPKTNYDGALAFLRFMADPTTQELIGQFGVDQFGEPLFFPDAELGLP